MLNIQIGKSMKPEIISMTHPLKSPFSATVKMTGKVLSIKNFSVKLKPKPYTLLPNGPELKDWEGKPFKFKNKKDRQEYIDRCLDIWGVVPCDVNWAIQTKIYLGK